MVILGIGEKVDCSIVRPSPVDVLAVQTDERMEGILARGQTTDALRFCNHFNVECWREGVLRWREVIKNNVTDEGKKIMLDAMFNSGTQYTTWYMSLINASPTPSYADGDTMSSHSGWVEYDTAYTEATRPEWTVGNASGTGASVNSTNSTPVSFTSDTAGPYSVAGIFVTSDSTKADTSGKLWTAVSFSANQSIDAPDVLKVTYTVTMAG